MEEITKHYLISGRVQGVGFRAFTERAAKALNVRGWVRNLQDGRVEALAQGTEEMLRQFAMQLREGPRHGQVDSLVVTDPGDVKIHLEFEVRKDGVEPWTK